MTGMITSKLNREDGAVPIVEAAFVFPIMFIILFFLIFMGNAQYIRAQAESIVASNAILGANYCADPVLQSIKESYSVSVNEKGVAKKSYTIPNVKEIKVKPYRYLFGGMDGVESHISDRVMNEFNSASFSLFDSMKPKLKTTKSNIAKFNNYIVYSTFSVTLKYEIMFPIKYLGESTPPLMTISSYTEVAVNDSTEFIRNTDMVMDYLKDTKVGDWVSGAFGKLNEFLTKFAGSQTGG